ncbi:GNAT family N-acetyltransferase [Dokdonella immobilis]|uniref:GNAT family N-acetyltransferase n=1 Tax=Dokdonella immobilis TaxID=578942 RepID=UPI000B86C653|nr:GNAT family N-acetyltransferase [Dokdonella immobilis]
MAGTLRVLSLRGAEIAGWLPAVARLRIAVFREYPYLYDGDEAYEARYLATYARSPGGVLVVVLDGEEVVGASTGMPLAGTEAEFQAPFLERRMPIETVFYCAESVLLREYRGRGLGHRFFDEREAHARALGAFAWTAFAAVDRAEDDPRCPADYRSNAPFWARRGYVRQPDMTMALAWKQVDCETETEQALTFWLRRLDCAK